MPCSPAALRPLQTQEAYNERENPMTDAHDATRRKLVIAASAAGAGLLVAAGNAGLVLAAQKGHGKGQEKEVGAVEDLMREHGVLRRALPAPANTSRGGESGRPGGHRQSGARKVKFARASPLEGDGFDSSVPVSGQRVEIATFDGIRAQMGPIDSVPI